MSDSEEHASATIPYRARFDECGPDAAIRAGTLLRWTQDAAWIHSERLGFGREWYADRGLAWLVRGLDLEVREPISMGTTATVTMQVTGFRRVMARRRTDVTLPNGDLAATVLTDWVMTGVARGMPTRIPDEFPALFAVPPAGFVPTRFDAVAPPAGASASSFTVRPHEIDPFRHANNASYLEWMEEAIAAAGGGAALAAEPRRYRIEYLAPASLGSELQARSWQSDGRRWQHVLVSADATVLARGSLTIE